MDDLISRKALLEFAHNHIGGRIDCNDIARFPAVEAEQVRHGEWVPVDLESPCDEWDCTSCGQRRTFDYRMDYDESLQSALDAHLAKALYHYHLTRAEKTAYENAVHACKSVLSRNAVKDWEKMDGGKKDENA